VQVCGNVAWIAATSAIVVLLPLRRAIEVEQAIIEQEFAEQQQRGGFGALPGMPGVAYQEK